MTYDTNVATGTGIGPSPWERTIGDTTMARDRRQHVPKVMNAEYSGACDVCGEVIGKGEEYVYVSFLDDVGPAMHKECYGRWKEEVIREEGDIGQ